MATVATELADSPSKTPIRGSGLMSRQSTSPTGLNSNVWNSTLTLTALIGQGSAIAGSVSFPVSLKSLGTPRSGSRILMCVMTKARDQLVCVSCFGNGTAFWLPLKPVVLLELRSPHMTCWCPLVRIKDHMDGLLPDMDCMGVAACRRCQSAIALSWRWIGNVLFSRGISEYGAWFAAEDLIWLALCFV